MVWTFDLVLTWIILGLQLIKIIVLKCFDNQIPFGTQIILILLELIVTCGLAIAQFNLERTLSGYLLSVGLSFILIGTALVREHLRLITLHMT